MTPEPPTHAPGEPDEPAATLRQSLRQTFKQRRGELSPAQRRAASEAIARHLAGYVTLHHIHTIAAFAATPTEVDLTPWIERHLGNGGSVALPRVGDRGLMEFHQYAAGAALENNRYNIAEPLKDSPQLGPAQIEAVLTPLVAFDSHGHRLGMGGGYYDRYLPRLRSGTPLVGVAFACQQTAEPLPRQAWDVPLHAVVTEDGVLEFPPTESPD